MLIKDRMDDVVKVPLDPLVAARRVLRLRPYILFYCCLQLILAFLDLALVLPEAHDLVEGITLPLQGRDVSSKRNYLLRNFFVLG